MMNDLVRTEHQTCTTPATSGQAMESTGPAMLFHHAWTQRNQTQPPETALESALLALHKTSDVNDIEPEQIRDARAVLLQRRALVESSGQNQATYVHSASQSSAVDAGDGCHPLIQAKEALLQLQRQIVERFLAGRRSYFGPDQCAPFPEAPAMAREGRNIFIVIKFMDEAPHIRATLQSLLNQKQIDMRRVVIVMVDNNSTDGSAQIIQEIAATHCTNVRIIYTNQSTPGGGSTARFGVDRSIATLYEMCRYDGAWDRLQTSVISVSDGDTVYHHHVLSEIMRILDNDPTVDGVMPFLTYKFTAALRLFDNYMPSFPEELRHDADREQSTLVLVDLSNTDAHTLLARGRRKRVDDEHMEVGLGDASTVIVSLNHTDRFGRKFGVLRDAQGNLAYLFQDRTLVLAQAPVSGFDAALVFLENGGVKQDEQWRWHTVIGHDLFLYWAFAGMRLPEEMIYPDTSDALKTFRTWSFAIGGQHQLSRPDLPIVTGTDYQSGRVLQATGCAIRLGSVRAYTETEVDRLTKMLRNFANRQHVFYGETRSSPIERASGLYLHMTRIQQAIEDETRAYSDDFFRDVAFPERILFPLRWMLQNAVRFYAHYEQQAQEIVHERVLKPMFSDAIACEIEQKWLHDGIIHTLRESEFAEMQSMAEKIAEGMIGDHYDRIMAFYEQTLRSFFEAHHVEQSCYEWLLDQVSHSRSAIQQERPCVHPSIVWQDANFIVDSQRGQVIGIADQT